MKIKNVSTDNNIFWKTAKDFLSHNLPNIRKVSEHTINAYRDGINKYIGYLENERLIKRENISFSDFRRDDLKDYLNWMLNIKKYAKKPVTFGLRQYIPCSNMLHMNITLILCQYTWKHVQLKALKQVTDQLNTLKVNK